MSRIDLDCRGLPCPGPIIELAKAVGAAEVDDVVAVASDDPAAGPDVRAFCRMRGQLYDGHELATDGVPVFRVRRVV